VATSSQQTQAEFDTSGLSAAVTTSRDDCSDCLTEVTSPLPIAASTGKSR
jgi:hypothetical protein